MNESVTISFERYDRMQDEMRRLKREVNDLREWNRNEVEMQLHSNKPERESFIMDLMGTLERAEGKAVRVKVSVL